MLTLQNYVAAGLPLDNPSVRIFRQSYVPAHSELDVDTGLLHRHGRNEPHDTV